MGLLLREGMLKPRFAVLVSALAGALFVACGNAHTPLPTATPSATPLPIPAQYQTLYNDLQDAIDTEDGQISSAWDGKLYGVDYATELLTADGNGGFGILQPAVKAMMLKELQAEHDMGATAVTVQIGFPIFDENLYTSLGQTQQQAGQTVQTWIDYYSSVAQAIHGLGMKMVVEANPLLTLATGSANSIDVSGYYKSLDAASYEQRRSAHNILVAQTIKPDYLLLQTEPTTDAVNSQNRALAALMSDPNADTEMIRGFVADLDQGQVPGLHSSILVGSGVGSWQADWQSYITNLAGIPGLDKLDTHVYNLQPGLDEIGIAEQVADVAHAAGKGASVSEYWFHKSTSLSGFTGADPLLDVRARDSFSFWSPLDQRFLSMMVKLANYKQFDYVSAFGFFYWFTLIDYPSLTTPCPPVYPAQNATENAACNAKIQTLRNQDAGRALSSGQLSSTGTAFRELLHNAGS
jgi:hypothetical protein